MRRTNILGIAAVVILGALAQRALAEGQYPSGSLSGAQQDYGSGRSWGMDACETEIRYADDYEAGPTEDRRITLETKLMASNKKLLTEAKAKHRAAVAGLKRSVPSQYHSFLKMVVMQEGCPGWTKSTYESHSIDIFGPAAASAEAESASGDKGRWEKLCSARNDGTGSFKIVEVCADRALVRPSAAVSDSWLRTAGSASGTACEEVFETIWDLSEKVSALETEIATNESNIAGFRTEAIEKEKAKLKAYQDTEGEECTTCIGGKKIPGWAWGLSIGADVLFNYGIKRGQDKDALYRARLGYPPAPRWLPGPVTTMGLASQALFGAGQGAYSCGAGYFGNGFPHGPAGQYGQNGVNAGFYGNTCGGSFGYPCQWSGQGYPGYNGAPGYNAGWGSGPGGWNGGIPGWGGQYPGYGQGQYPGYGQFPGGGQYPGYGQFPGGGQYPGYGQFPGGGQFPGYGQFPGGGQYPGYGQFPGGGQYPGGPGSPQWQVEMQNQQNRQQAVSLISSQIWQLQSQLQQIQGSMGGGYGYGSGPGYGYGSGSGYGYGSGGGYLSGGYGYGSGGFGAGIGYGSWTGGLGYSGGYYGSPVTTPVLIPPVPGTSR